MSVCVLIDREQLPTTAVFVYLCMRIIVFVFAYLCFCVLVFSSAGNVRQRNSYLLQLYKAAATQTSTIPDFIGFVLIFVCFVVV